MNTARAVKTPSTTRSTAKTENTYADPKSQSRFASPLDANANEETRPEEKRDRRRNATGGETRPEERAKAQLSVSSARAPSGTQRVALPNAQSPIWVMDGRKKKPITPPYLPNRPVFFSYEGYQAHSQQPSKHTKPQSVPLAHAANHSVVCKFRSSNSSFVATLPGPFITLSELKNKIRKLHHLYKDHLKITNAQTRIPYTEDDVVHSNVFLLVQRTPRATAQQPLIGKSVDLFKDFPSHQ